MLGPDWGQVESLQGPTEGGGWGVEEGSQGGMGVQGEGCGGKGGGWGKDCIDGLLGLGAQGK